ncbi:hypothetical protein [Alteromonas lipolytica]|uniref:Lipoprotein n=1 Tax=Alteromonas lipolytica TaxID=1856405 RepID=A0A1E8FCJ2_9ALTE|nr:hypothetical protein [Alteromonas lipolytica]OFI33652.1 hypothetical protein BFC17_18910 [Alteromonas lipolytica]GGF69634.1 hypothetical protein GCM10011338_22230 [Alteromonas lipolytica]
MNKIASMVILAPVLAFGGCQSTTNTKQEKTTSHYDRAAMEQLLNSVMNRIDFENAVPNQSSFKETGSLSTTTFFSRETRKMVSYGSVAVESKAYGATFSFTVTGECEITTSDERFDSFIRINGQKVKTLAACLPSPEVSETLGAEVNFMSHVMYTDQAIEFVTKEMLSHSQLFAEIDGQMWLFKTEGFINVYKAASEVAI